MMILDSGLLFWATMYKRYTRLFYKRPMAA